MDILFTLCLHWILISSGLSCQIPTFFQGEYFSLERGESRNTIITGTQIENELFLGECKQLEQIPNTGVNDTYDARALLFSRNSACYTCLELYFKTPNVIQMKMSTCFIEDVYTGSLDGSAGTLGNLDLCTTIFGANSEVVTIFRKVLETVNCSGTLSGTYQFSYETQDGGAGVCDNRNSFIKACQSLGTPYVDNQVFTMHYASCADVASSFDEAFRYQCLGTWRDGDTVYSAVADLAEEQLNLRYKCMVIGDLDTQSRELRISMTRFSTCSNVFSIYDGPIRFVLRALHLPQDAPCDYSIDIEGASRDTSSSSVIRYNCQPGLHFSDGTTSQNTTCNCDSIDDILMWGMCRIQTTPMVTEPPVPSGPRIIQNPENFLYNEAALAEPIFYCTATGYPEPVYHWYRQDSSEKTWVEIDTNEESSYVIETGKLTITSPNEAIEKMTNFVCIAENIYGSVRSKSASVVLAYINDFPRSMRDPINAQMNHGVIIECQPPQFGGYEGLVYAWYKDSVFNFLRNDVPHIFMSLSGRLFISAALSDDSGNYHCIVSAGTPAVQKISMPIGLQVMEGISTMPITMAPDFPAVYPTQSLQGNNVTLECFAFGGLGLNYKWEKLDGPLPDDAVFAAWNHSMTIVNLDYEDVGTYRCVVTDSLTEVYGTVNVSIDGSPPMFEENLDDYHIIYHEDVFLRGMANGDPAVSYKWFVNGSEITDEMTQNRFIIDKNELTIKTIHRDGILGMYQLEASNMHGVVYSTAQISGFGPVPKPVSNAQKLFHDINFSCIMLFTICLLTSF